MLCSDDIGLIKEKLSENNELSVLCKILASAIKYNNCEYTKIMADHIKNKIMKSQTNISLADWQYFLNILNNAIQSEPTQAFRALRETGCLNTKYLADDGNKFSVLAWIKHMPLGSNFSTESYLERKNLINLYIRYGAESRIENTVSHDCFPCTLL